MIAESPGITGTDVQGLLKTLHRLSVLLQLCKCNTSVAVGPIVIGFNGEGSIVPEKGVSVTPF